MRILLLYNPIAGRGRSEQAANDLRDHLKSAAHEPRVLPTRREPACTWLDDQLVDHDLLVILGGDGAIRGCLGAAARTQTPIYQIPFGTENLFAREFGMTQDAERLVSAISRRDIRTFDLGRANGRWFGLMASVGLDAEVVHHLDSIRSGAISHRSYVLPTLKQFMIWKAAPLEVVVDGERVDHGGPSFVVVGNCRQYGWRLNPAHRAEMNDGELDVAVFPIRSRVGLARWAIRARLGRLGQAKRLIYRRGREVEIRCSHSFRYQLDGDPPGSLDDAEVGEADDALDRETSSLRIKVLPSALAVLVPDSE